MDVKDLVSEAIVLQNDGHFDAAKKLCLEALSHQPRHDDAHYVLACIYQRQGQIDSAITSVNIAIDIDPGKSQFFNLLGVCYLRKEQSAAAELSFCHAIRLQSDYADAYNNLGLLLIGKSRVAEAQPLLEKALTLTPNDANMLCNMGSIYIEKGEYQKALDLYERACALRPQSSSPMLGKVAALQKIGRIDEALIAIDQVPCEDAITTAEALRRKTVLLYYVGRLDDACETIDRALTVAPESFDLVNSRSQLRKVKSDEAFFHRLQSLESRVETISGEAKTNLCYALGKAYDDVGNMAAAAKYYAVGGSNVLQSRPYDERNDIELFATLKHHFTGDYLTALAAEGSKSERPIFILGMERSGTTLVEQLLASHPSVFAAGELPYVAKMLGGFILPDGVRFSSGGELPDRRMSILERAEGYLSKIDALTGSAERAHSTDKMPDNFVNIGLIHAMFPRARIIHCRRDPVDNCISSYTSHFVSATQWSFDLSAMGRRYRAYWDMMAHWRKVLPGRFLELRYEQVVENTEQAARTLLEWCGLPWDEQVMRFYETDRPVLTASAAQVRRPIYKSSMGRWKKWEPYIQPLLSEIAEIEQQYWAELGK